MKNYLLTWVRKGYRVVEGRPPLVNGWTVVFAPLKFVGIRPGPTKGLWSVHAGNLLRSIGEVGTMAELRAYFEAACQSVGVPLAGTPLQQHTTNEAPISVWVKLASMIGTTTVEAVYDPYFDFKTLANLAAIADLGVKYATALKILTAKNTVTLDMLGKFNTQLSINAEFKVTTKKHLRLIFLTDGRCLSPDFSLNQEQLGTINTVDASPKMVFFNDAWRSGIPLTV